MIISKAVDNKWTTKIYLSDDDNVKPIFSGQPVSRGGTGEHMRSGYLLLAGFASCMNSTTRKMLDKQNLQYDDVIVCTDFDNSNEEVTKFYSKIEIVSNNIEQSKKDEIIKAAKDCTICKVLKSKAEFYDM